MMIERVPIEPEELIHQLAAKMRAANLRWEKSKPWTDALKASVTSLLESEGTKITEVLCSNSEKEMSEFLLDIVVWDRSEGEGVTLAVESEWLQNVDAVAEDFWKLLVVKAPIKLMIFACNKRPVKFSQDAVWAKLSDCLMKYRDHLEGERYIFMDYAPAPGRKAWWVTIPQSGKLDSVPERHLVDFE